MPTLWDTRASELLAARGRHIAAFGFTQRQARFLVLVMEHSGVFMGRQYATFAGISHGQKVHDFIERLLSRDMAQVKAFGPTGRVRLFHVHYKPLYRAIEQQDNRHRKPVPLGRAVERMMLLDAVLAKPELVWLGTERDKRMHFATLGDQQLRDAELPRLTFGKGAGATLRYFPDKLPIGISSSARDHDFVYLVTDRSPMNFRLFLLRHVELFRAVGAFTIRLVFPSIYSGLQRVYARAVYEQLACGLRPYAREEMEALFKARRGAQNAHTEGQTRRAFLAPEGVTGPALKAFYRRWREAGDASLWPVDSVFMRERFERGEAKVECTVLNHQYVHLSRLVGTA